MSGFLQFLTTTVIWLAYTGTVIASLLMGSRVESWVTGLIVVVFGLLAAFGTEKIWASNSAAAPAVSDAQDSTKAKRDRQARLARLLDQMDDDEIVELETLMAAHQDGQGL